MLAEDPGRTQPRAAYPRRCSSNASGLHGRGIRRGSWKSARAQLVSPAQTSLPRPWPTPELPIPNAAAQTRIVSKARIRLDSRKKAFGGLDRESLRFLNGLARYSGSPRRQLKPGTVLV